MTSDVGKLDKRVSFYNPNPTDETERDGQPVEDPEWIGTVWGQLTPVGGDEAPLADRQQSLTTHQLRIRYRADVLASGSRWYCIISGRKFEILSSIDLEEDRRFLVIDLIQQYVR